MLWMIYLLGMSLTGMLACHSKFVDEFEKRAKAYPRSISLKELKIGFAMGGLLAAIIWPITLPAMLFRLFRGF